MTKSIIVITMHDNSLNEIFEFKQHEVMMPVNMV